MGRLTGKTVLITGAARGQGRAHAIRLAEEGADIVATDICTQLPEIAYAMSTRDDLDHTAKLVEQLDRRCLAFTADAGDLGRMREVVDEAVAEFGHLDAVVINHGLSTPHSIDQEDADAIFDAIVAANLTAVWRTARAAVPALRASGGGGIVITSSAAGIRAFGGLPGYVASKQGVLGLMQALAIELAPSGIRVNAVCPGNVATPMLHNQFLQSLFAGGKPDATKDDMVFPAKAMSLQEVPWVEPEAISNGVLYLLSDEAKYVTGIALPIDTGMLAQPPGITAFIGEHLAPQG